MKNLYHKGKKLGKIVNIQFFNNAIFIAYIDKTRRIREAFNSEDLTYGRPKITFYKPKKKRKKFRI